MRCVPKPCWVCFAGPKPEPWGCFCCGGPRVPQVSAGGWGAQKRTPAVTLRRCQVARGEEAELSPGCGKKATRAQRQGPSATCRPRRLARTGEKLAARQNGRREPGRLSRRPGNAGSSEPPKSRLPGIPPFARLGTGTGTLDAACCQSWSPPGLSGSGVSTRAFPADGGVPGADPWGPHPSSLSPGQRLKKLGTVLWERTPPWES